jgi:hypothetical protein
MAENVPAPAGPPPRRPDRGGSTGRLPSGTSYGPQGAAPRSAFPEGPPPPGVERPKSVGRDVPGTESHPTANPNYRGRDPDPKRP